MAENNIEKKIEELLSKIIEDMGYVLYDVEYVKEGKEYHLCIYIDKDDGININDCERVTEAINPILDKADLIKQQYLLEVSSSGLEKSLRKSMAIGLIMNTISSTTRVLAMSPIIMDGMIERSRLNLATTARYCRKKTTHVPTKNTPLP